MNDSSTSYKGKQIEHEILFVSTKYSLREINRW